MNTRDYKFSAPGEFFHVYNRGNAKDIVFVDDLDYRFFLLKIRQNLIPGERVSRHFRPLPDNSFDLVAYCLMPNHFHILIKQNREIPTSKLLGKVCTSYAMYFNRKYERVGHIFQDQFKQSHIDSNRYLTWLSAYIHNNPVKAKLVDRPKRWEYSSYSDFVEQRDTGSFVKPDIILNQFSNSSEYKNFVLEALDTEQEVVSEELLLDF